MPAVSTFRPSARSGPRSTRYVEKPGPYGYRKEKVEPNYNNFNRQTRSSTIGFADTKSEAVKEIDRFDSVVGFDRYESGPKKTGWLVNFHTTTIPSEEVLQGLVGVDYYFLDEEGGSFKVTMSYDPYFLVKCQAGTESEVEEYLRKFLESIVKKVEQISKEDLRQPNHLLGIERKLLKLSFHNITDLLEARRMLRPIVDRNERSKEGMDIYKSVNLNYSTMLKEDTHEEMKDTHHSDPSELIEELREYDVPYHSRVSIDKDIRVGKWYDVEADNDHVVLTERKDKIAFADPVVLAFDIETTKAPLKFPDSAIDQVMMISYMIDGDGYLITNRDIISEDIMDFEYTPRPEYPGSFTIFNEINEKALLERFFEHIREVRPTVIATFNGDFFDWPFVEARAAYHGIDMHHEIGFAKDSEDEYKSSYCSHMDCFRWVKRDSYLPQGAQGLKAVTTAKLGYNPTELDPELMTPYAYEKPQTLAEYSVSDAVATYYLYYKYVHPFIFSLCTIIPLNPDEVLRKGTGTLCEVLLTVQAYTHGIVLPNKHTDPLERFYEGHLIESETYVGGHVESLEAGVFRADLDTDFKIDPTAVDLLLDDLEGALKFAITEEDHQKLEDVTNFEEVHQEVKKQLLAFKEHTKIREPPVIYHVDVSSMYPNIMISNRLQPDSMKSEEDCAACDFNRPGKKCDRRLSWAWRGEFYPADMSDYSMMKNAMQNESFPPRKPGMPNRTFSELSYAEQTSYLKKHVSDYSRKVYHRIKQSEIVEREAIICQRENPFYVNTVRSFRDRRYEFKGLAKLWKKKLHQVNKDDKHALDEAKKLAVLYDSMQLAHKVILNSFYGYVMRKGSRWYSMEMAGVTCLTGATIIQMARALIGRLGRPLELDTDGIWCALPKSFPDTFTFNLKNGKSISTTYPCSMLNYIVHKRFTNDQYQMLVDPEKMRYETHSENTIFFEADGPYKAMILPTSKEEGKGLKKRYAVFNFDGTLAELKGFELKRRGELQLIKNFQSDIFKLFLDGSTLEECYDTVATVANRWLDVLETHGKMLEDEDLIELICQNRSMSKALEDYGNQKSTSITTARRLGEFLGEEMVKDKGLACKYIVADRPLDAPVTERAIPTAIFSSELSVKRKYLRRWLKDPSLEDFDPRSIIDWDYYRERLASVIQKIITIPAALQGVANPVPRVAHPDWMQKRIDTMSDKMKQSSLTSFFTKAPAGSKPVMPSVPEEVQDIEDIGEVSSSGVPKVARVVSRRKRRLGEKESELEIEQQILRQPMPDPAVDYVSFLNYEKVKWNMQAKERERRQKLFGRSFQMTTDKGAVEGYLQRRAETYATSLWQVIQYQADPAHPGDLQVFALIGGKIQSLTLHIEKKIYVKFKSGNLPDGSIENCELSRSVESLPTGGDSENLFKLVMPEQVYIEELNKVDSVLKSTSVAGVYESYISAEDRAIMDLGTCLKFDDKKMNLLAKSFENGFSQKNLKPMPAEGYLQRFSMGILYLLHIISNGYEIFTLFNSTDPTAYMYVLKASSTAQQLPPKMGAYYRDIFKAKKSELGKYYSIIDYPSEISFETHYFSDIGKLHRKLNARIAALNERSASKFLFAIQSPYPANLRRVFKVSSSMPTVTMNIGEIQVSALSWHGLIMKRIVNHYLSLSSWIKKLMDLSRYSNIPLCNLKVDNMGYLIDIEYARRLTTAGIILWWSPTPTPDYGGSEKDRALFEADDSLQFPHFNSPEAYDTVCLEVDVKNLTINTVLTSSFINEAEGVFISESGENKGTEDSEAATFADDSFSGPALAVLRGLARHWWDDAIKDNAEADSMVHGFISWYSNPGSFMYDSSLHYHVHNLTKKSFVQLLGEFKRLGAGIVFADRNKIILKTTKTVVENSYAYGQYLVSSVRSKPLFNLLELNISRYWDMLVWMDKYNHAGSFCDEILGEDEQKLDYMSKWQIRQYLPIIMQGEFDDWVILFLDALIKDREREYQSSGQTQNSPRRTQITQILKQHKFNSAVIDMDSIEHGVCEYFRNPLLKRVKTLIRKQNEMQLDPTMRQEFEFPKLAGSHLNLTNPALELVKDLCQILSVSKRRNLEVRMLRKELLSLFEVKEFSEEGIFKNPSASLIIPQVICDYCDFTKDIDVCRDDEKDIFHCDSCHRAYNKLIIEEKLIYELERTVTKYLTQDLKCDRCGRMKDREISLHCPCSGDWISTISRSKMLTRIRVFQNVAEAYRFKLLRDITEEFI